MPLTPFGLGPDPQPLSLLARSGISWRLLELGKSHESGAFERIRPHLTPLWLVIIVQANPEGAISRKVALIWGIQAKFPQCYFYHKKRLSLSPHANLINKQGVCKGAISDT